jgi:molybdopterin-guanine dinucleotide biosynthesis protein A
MKFPCSGVILAGGMNTRFSGRDKAFIPVGGKPIVERLGGIFQELFEEIILVTNTPQKYLAWDFHIVTDLFPFRSSLTGIHAGLFHATKPYAFFAACDTPFLKKEMVQSIVDAIEAGVDIVIPQTSAGMEPLCAVYATRCLKSIEMNLARRKLKIQMLFKKVRVKKIRETVLRDIDRDLISFFNINSPEDLARAEVLVADQTLAGSRFK